MALILSANPKANEVIYIQFKDELVKMTVAKDESSARVKLSFEAPITIKIDREKVYLSKQQNI
jgi:sRNA-binding carbon storage regulator CsrA